MTELQKLSLKKLREMELPLYVIDRKSKKKMRGGFVISHMDPSNMTPSQNKLMKKSIRDIDLRKRGLFWDRSDMSNSLFFSILEDETHPEHIWATTRLLERLSSTEILKSFSISEIEKMVQKSRIRPFIRRPWEHAINYWNQKT